VHQLFELKRLRDEPFGAEPRHLDRFAHRAKSRDHDGDDLRIAAKRFIEHLPPVDARQPQVGDEDIERELVEARHGLLAGSRLDDLKALLDEPLRDHLAKSRLVVDKQKMLGRRVSHDDP
jgi:hypothetical protein